LIIYMIFKLTISFLKYIIAPETFGDKNKGAANIIKRVIISILLLASINPIFNVLFDVQSEILEQGVIESFILGDKNDVIYDDEEGNPIYFTQMSEMCEEVDKTDGAIRRTITRTQGDHFALLVLKPFVQPNENIGINQLKDEKISYCGTRLKKADGGYTLAPEVKAQLEAAELLEDVARDDKNPTIIRVLVSLSAKEIVNNAELDTVSGAKRYLSLATKNDAGNAFDVLFMDNNFYIDFAGYGLWATIVGAVVLLILLSFCFDVVVRSFTLLLLQIIAPIPIISYVSPDGKSSEMLSSWGKKLFNTWLSLFIRIGVVTLAVSFIGCVCETDVIKMFGNGNISLFAQIILIIGTLMFAKKLPKLLEELFPGLKMSGGSFTLNPFKKIESEALGGKQINGALIGGATALATGALLAPGANLANNIRKRRNNEFKPEDRTLGKTVHRTLNAFGQGVTYGAYNGLRTGYGAGKSGKFNVLRESINATQKASDDRNTNIDLIKQGAVKPNKVEQALGWEKPAFAKGRFMAHNKYTDVIGYRGKGGSTDEMKTRIKTLNNRIQNAEAQRNTFYKAAMETQNNAPEKIREAMMKSKVLHSEIAKDANGNSLMNENGGNIWKRNLSFEERYGNNSSDYVNSLDIKERDEYNNFKTNYLDNMNHDELEQFKSLYDTTLGYLHAAQDSENERLEGIAEKDKLSKNIDKQSNIAKPGSK